MNNSRGTTLPEAPSDRYPVPRRRGVVLASGIVGVLALGWLGWVIYDHSTPEVVSSIKTFDISSEHHAEAEFVVRLRNLDVQATCLLRAFAVDHSTVGETNVKVPTGEKNQIVSGVIRTERRATSIELIGCTASGQRSAR